MANGVQFSGENVRYCTLLGGRKGGAMGFSMGMVKRRAVLGGRVGKAAELQGRGF